MVLGEQYPSGERGRVESDASIRVDLKNLEITRPPGAAWMQAVVLRDQSIPLHITLRKETCKDFAALNDFEGKLFAAKSTLEQGLPDQGDQPPGPDEVARAHREAVRSRHAPKTDEKKQAAEPWSPQTHQLFPSEARERAVELTLLGARLSRESRFDDIHGSAMGMRDVWMAYVVPHAVSRGYEASLEQLLARCSRAELEALLHRNILQGGEGALTREDVREVRWERTNV